MSLLTLLCTRSMWTRMLYPRMKSLLQCGQGMLGLPVGFLSGDSSLLNSWTRTCCCCCGCCCCWWWWCCGCWWCCCWWCRMGCVLTVTAGKEIWLAGWGGGCFSWWCGCCWWWCCCWWNACDSSSSSLSSDISYRHVKIVLCAVTDSWFYRYGSLTSKSFQK